MTANPVMEEYVKQVYHLEREHSRRVRTTEVADAMSRTRASATHMIRKLDEKGMVEYEQYQGVAVSERGERIALQLVRKHRLLETFLSERLGIAWSEVHEEADRLEHHISDDLAERLDELLGHPRTDPHGDPIPDSDLTFPSELSATALTNCDSGELLVVDQVPDHQSEVRNYLYENDIDPGSEVEIEEISPIGLVTITNRDTGATLSIPDRVARQVTASPNN